MKTTITMSVTAMFAMLANGIETEDEILEIVKNCMEIITGNPELQKPVHISRVWIDEMGNPCGMMIVMDCTTYDIDFDTGKARKVA